MGKRNQKNQSNQNNSAGSRARGSSNYGDEQTPALSPTKVQAAQEEGASGNERYFCGHCKLECTDEGKGNEALCCDFCEVWVHAACEGISSDIHKLYDSKVRVFFVMSAYSFDEPKFTSARDKKEIRKTKAKN